MGLPDVDFSKYDIVWLGENHGIKENYLAYRAIIPLLATKGFTNIAWEMPEGENIAFDDGRFSSDQKKFRLWLGEQLKTGGIASICLIDSRDFAENQQDGETKMANNIATCAKKGKTIVISGDLHSQKKMRMVMVGEEKTNPIKITPSAGLVQQSGFKIFTIGLSYTGGFFYNFGIRKFNPSCYSFNKAKQRFGTWLTNTNPLVDNDYWLCVGRAHAVTPTQNLNKPTIK